MAMVGFLRSGVLTTAEPDRTSNDRKTQNERSNGGGRPKRGIVSLVAYGTLLAAYALTLLVAAVGSLIPHRRWKRTGRIAVTGTFHNPGWYLSHVVPLTRSGVKEVILVVDEPQAPLERVRFVCPPRLVAKVLSRAVAKALWMVVAGLRYRPDLYMGYHILPGACSALVAARLFGRPACYQMTGGPIEILGGGLHNESWLTSSLARSSPFLERLATMVVRQFDLVVVRGTKARAFCTARRPNGVVAIVTGSISARRQPAAATKRPFDLVFAGRLTEIKQPLQLVEITAAVKRCIPSLQAVVIGDGPLMEAMRQRADALQVADRILFYGKCEDMEPILAGSKVFVLTSRSEGLSIALAEAMAAGAVPVVADVGELSDLVEDGANGFLVEPNELAQYVDRIVTLLSSPALWERYSSAAREAAARACGINVVSEQWRHHLEEVVDHAARTPTT
jgi:glycosyltransferase involved in cell wall biosynthesis